MRSTCPPATSAPARCARVGRPGLRLHRRQQFVARQAELAEAGADLAHADVPSFCLRLQAFQQFWGCRIQPQTENVNRLGPPGGRQLHPRHQPDAAAPRLAVGVTESGHGVVIGEGQHLYAGGGGALHQIGGGQGAVGVIRVCVQVDEQGVAHDGVPASPTASSRRPDSTMNPCDRSKPSEV